jgi:hypothetical protein
MCSDKVIVNPIANPPELNFVQEVIHSALQTLHNDLIDMHTQHPKIVEDNKFPKVLTIKQLPGKIWKLINSGD